MIYSALLLILRQVSQILHVQFKPGIAMHKLQWLAESVSIKRCAQHFMANCHLIERHLHLLRLEGHAEVKAANVDAVIRAEFAMEDHARLQLRYGIGVLNIHRHFLAVLQGDHAEGRIQVAAFWFYLRVADRLTQLADRRILEKLLKRKGHSPLQGLCAGLDAADGIAAHVKEIVVNSNAAEVESFPPCFGQRFLQGSTWRRMAVDAGGCAPFRLW